MTIIEETIGPDLDELGPLMNGRPLRDRRLFTVVIDDEGRLEVCFGFNFADAATRQRFADAVMSAVVRRACGDRALREFTAMNFMTPRRA